MSSQWGPLDSYTSDHLIAQDHLGRSLRSGELCLVLGAGVSAGLGLPTWLQLVKSCADQVQVDLEPAFTTSASAMQLLKAADAVRRKCSDDESFRGVVQRCLYGTGVQDEALLVHRLLIVLGSLTMKSRRRSVCEVLTFNFDDFLERYLRLHGFATQVIVSLPALRRDIDVTVYHPHGFLSSAGFGTPSSDFLIFSKYSFDERLGDRLNPWTELARDLLLRKIGVFVGLSCEGPNIGPLLSSVKRELRGQSRPVGFWLLGPQDTSDSESQLLDWNVAPIRLNNYDAYASFLLGICQQAAK